MQSQLFIGVNIHIHTYTSRCLLERKNDTHIHTSIPTLELACTNMHTSRGAPLFSTSRSASNTKTHKQLSTGDLVDDYRQTYTHPYPRLIPCANTHTPPGSFLFHTYRSVSHTLSLRTYCTSMGRVFLVETVLQTML